MISVTSKVENLLIIVLWFERMSLRLLSVVIAFRMKGWFKAFLADILRNGFFWSIDLIKDFAYFVIIFHYLPKYEFSYLLGWFPHSWYFL